MAAKKKADTVYTVAAPLVQAMVGGRVLHFYRGDILPKGVDEASMEHLIGLGFVEGTDVSEPEPEPEPDPTK